ncbi:MAG: UDP-2,3-diacylglucosamine diphosphatase [Candidatus Fermentibacteraceae bacterium]|nr:UDP-2,3-diacylglucosamine diphosphatase [Candidatus Fermentibacteraceae bacterium]MBN2607861.1 UDP-2,3-diacylglucosamine diphosphatase [Candidatus Fermentibacteraceae bacterium]
MERLFISDAHLFPEHLEHPGRERLLSFLKGLALSRSPGELWILGDLFDFWFEYASVMPAGHLKCLCSIRELSDRGWRVSFLPGNHDCWAGRHFQQATGASVYPEGQHEIDAEGTRVLLAHGDGLGPGDLGYKLLKPVLRSSICRFMFRMLHPDLGTRLARKFSDTSRRILRRDLDTVPKGLVQWAEKRMDEGFGIIITGHTHLDTVIRSEKGIYVSLGDWLTRFTYCRLADGSGEPELLEYSPSDGEKGGEDEDV